MSTYLFELESVRYKYPDGTEALRDINIKILPGKIYSIIGATGSGKSTLLMLLAGLLPPTGGVIRYKGIPMYGYRGVRREVSLMFQDPSLQFICDTVFDEIVYGPRQLGMDVDSSIRRISPLISKLGVESMMNKSPLRLSGGEARRLGIIVALAHDPETILLDEPFNDLSYNYMNALKEVLISLKHGGKNIILTSNRLSDVLDVSDEVILLEGGKIRWSGPIECLLGNMDIISELGLDIPLHIRIMDELGIEWSHSRPPSTEELMNLLKRHIRPR